MGSGGKTLLVRGQFIHFEDSRNVTSQAFGPFEELIARVELVDKPAAGCSVWLTASALHGDGEPGHPQEGRGPGRRDHGLDQHALPKPPKESSSRQIPSSSMNPPVDKLTGAGCVSAPKERAMCPFVDKADSRCAEHMRFGNLFSTFATARRLRLLPHIPRDRQGSWL